MNRDFFLSIFPHFLGALASEELTMLAATRGQRTLAYERFLPSQRHRKRRRPNLESLEVRELLTYTVSSLGELLPSGSNSAILVAAIVAINATADSSGTVVSVSGNTSRAFLQINDGPRTTLVPVLSEPKSIATGINDDGQVVGDSLTIGGGLGGSPLSEQAVSYNQGRGEQLGTLGGIVSTATGINNSGEIVGSSEAAAAGSPTHAVIFDGSGPPQDLGTLGGGQSESYATAINNSDQIIGESTIGSPFNSLPVAFLDSDSGVLTSTDSLGLPTTGGYTSSYANAINNEAQIVGYAAKPETGTTGDVDEAFMNYQKQWTDIGTLGGIGSVAEAINDSGLVVGYSATSIVGLGGTSPIHAFLYNPSTGLLQDLNNLIPSNPQWTLETATAINDNGDIAGGWDRPRR